MITEENEQILLRNSLRDHVRWCNEIIEILDKNQDFEVGKSTNIMRRANVKEMEYSRVRILQYATKNMTKW